MGLLQEMYDKSNNLNREPKEDINDVIYVSFFDVLKEKTVKRKVYQMSNCLCLETQNVHKFYTNCPKCQGLGTIKILNNDLICNCCKGKGKIVKEECPICKGKTTILRKEEIEICLNKSLLENPLLVVDKKRINQGNLVLKVVIYDKDFYFIKDDDIYSKKVLYFAKKDFKVSKEIETMVDFSNIKLEKIVYQQVIKLEGKGLNGKDFYQPVQCEVEGNKGKNNYGNIILEKKEKGIYLKKESLYSQNLVFEYSLTKPLNDPNYLYLDLSKFNKNYDILTFEEKGFPSIDGGKNGDLIIKVFVGKYFIKDNALYRIDEQLTKTELSSHKKSIIVDNEKYLANMEKNKENNYFLNMGKFGLLDKNNKQGDFYTLINQTYSIYRISTFNKSSHFYIEDYQHFFGEKVKSYTSCSNMENYIEVNAMENPTKVKDREGNLVIVSLLKKEEL